MISYFKYKKGISESDKWPVFKGHTLQFIQIAAKMYMAKLDAGWFISNLLIEKQKIIFKKVQLLFVAKWGSIENQL